LRNGAKNREKTRDFLKKLAIFVQKSSIFTQCNSRLYLGHPLQGDHDRWRNMWSALGFQSHSEVNYDFKTISYENSLAEPHNHAGAALYRGSFT
jgi:hypothetical protein